LIARVVLVLGVNGPAVVTRERVEAWLAKLEADGVGSDRDVLMQLWALGPESSTAASPLVATMQNESSALRGLAARWLGQVGRGQLEVAQALAHAMHAPDEALRRACVIALGDLGCATEAVLERLDEQLRAEGEQLRVLAAGSLLRLVPTHADAVQVLRSARASDDYMVRDRAASAFARVIATVPSAVGDAIDFLGDGYSPIVECVAHALARASVDDVVPRLLEIVRHGEPNMQSGALFALREVGANAAPFRDAITTALLAARVFDADVADIRRRAANVAQATRLDAPPVVAKLRGLLHDGEEWVQEQAACALLSFPHLDDDIRREADTTLSALYR
jgi:HEAT repeat protein